jgi:PAS domain S-box-containing protein
LIHYSRVDKEGVFSPDFRRMPAVSYTAGKETLRDTAQLLYLAGVIELLSKGVFALLSVLLIDDEPALLEVFRLFSERSKEMSIHTTQSAKEALGILPQKKFDAIVVNYDKSEIDGIEFLKMLRSEGDTTPVIIFTGAGHDHAAIEAINQGTNAFLKKGENPEEQVRELVSMVKTALEMSGPGKNTGSTGRVISDMINFSSDPGFAIDREGKVVAWNNSMEQLTGTSANEMMGKSDYVYSEPFFGTRRKMLANLIFEPDEEIKRQKYMIVSRVDKGQIIAVIKGKKRDGSEWTLWAKAMPLYDGQGNFLAAVETIRDVTATFKDIATHDESQDAGAHPGEVKSPQPAKPVKGIFDKILGKTTSYYKEGVILYIQDKRYPEAIAAFNKALEIDDKLPHVWNDLGLCYREMGDYKNSLKSCLRAVEHAPENPEFLFNLGETLEMIGVLYMSDKYLESAIQTFKMVANVVPNNANTWNHIGICYNELGKPEESRFYFDRARDIHIWKKDTPIIPRRNEFL